MANWSRAFDDPIPCPRSPVRHPQGRRQLYPEASQAGRRALDALRSAKSRVRPMDGKRLRPATPNLGIYNCTGRLAHDRTLAESRYLRMFADRTPLFTDVRSALRPSTNLWMEEKGGIKTGYQVKSNYKNII
jgi:hypothetical protein